VEDRISRLQDKTDNKEKIGDSLDKRFNSCDRNMQEFCNLSKHQTCESWALKK
jgi:hypothetical protein